MDAINLAGPIMGESFGPDATHPGSESKSNLSFVFHASTTTIPRTIHDAELLLHALGTRSDACQFELNALRMKIHQANLQLQILCHVAQMAEWRLQNAQTDIGVARKVLHDSELDVSFAESCGTCSDILKS
ncbi:hypothetical protein HMN09_00296800 [Mycena chlorophos]|uniref:Uncharacterized protein n=1 Tax=Mycena chlorophos TaxID=658473 RepID=A0A8H6TMS4_MYCCL|nr:hypothetical protein HMN09_00296800 [Mycena chlorophos]